MAPFVPSTRMVLKRDKVATVCLVLPILFGLIYAGTALQHAAGGGGAREVFLRRQELTALAVWLALLPLLLVSVYRVRHVRETFELGVLVDGTITRTHPIMAKTPASLTYTFQGEEHSARVDLPSRECHRHFATHPRVRVAVLPDNPRRFFVAEVFYEDPCAGP